ncbi:uncharacterized protein LOC135399162 isoform X2 [Ornithodoros turicata]|uniref:uncharacterized protein LOC135399162 isoform X2 n=1 Tax=Ornithodoros turicata TaxID=34597 RepID=UPI0031395E73
MLTVLRSTVAAFLVQIAVVGVGSQTDAPGLRSATGVYLPESADEDTNQSKRGYGLPCTRDNDCFVSRGLACRDLRCNCSALTPVHIKDKGTCLPAKAMYEACMYNEECAKGSANLLCLDYLCYCPFPYVLKDNSQCVASPPPLLRTLLAVVPTASLVFIACFIVGAYACKKLSERHEDTGATLEEGNSDKVPTRPQWAVRSLGDRTDSTAIKLENTNLDAIHDRFLRFTRGNPYRQHAPEDKSWGSKRPPRFIRTPSTLENNSTAGAVFPITLWSSSEDISAVHRITPDTKKKQVFSTPGRRSPEDGSEKLLDPTTNIMEGDLTEDQNKNGESELNVLNERSKRKQKNPDGSEELQWQETPSGQADDSYVVEPMASFLRDSLLKRSRTQRKVQMTLECHNGKVPSPQAQKVQKIKAIPDVAEHDAQKPLTSLFERSRRNIDAGNVRFQLQLPRSLKPANPFAKDYSPAVARVSPFSWTDDVLPESESVALSFVSSMSSHEVLPKPDIQMSLLKANPFKQNDPDAVPRFSAALWSISSQEEDKSGASSGRRHRRGPTQQGKESGSDTSESVQDLRIKLISSICKPISVSPVGTSNATKPFSPTSAVNDIGSPSTSKKGKELSSSGESAQNISMHKDAIDDQPTAHTTRIGSPKTDKTSSDLPQEGAGVGSKTGFQKRGLSPPPQDIYIAMVRPGSAVMGKPSGTLKRLQRKKSAAASKTKEVCKIISPSVPKEKRSGKEDKQNHSERKGTGRRVTRSLGSREDNYMEAATKMMVAMMGNEHYRRERSHLRQSITAGLDENKPPVIVGVALDEAQYILQYDVNLQQQPDQATGRRRSATEWRHSPRPGTAESQVFVTRKTTAISNVSPCFIDSLMSREDVQVTPLPLKDIIKLQHPQVPPMVMMPLRKGNNIPRRVPLPTVNESSTSVNIIADADIITASSSAVQEVSQRDYKAEEPNTNSPMPKPRLTPLHASLSREMSTEDTSSTTAPPTDRRQVLEAVPVPFRRNVTCKEPAEQSAPDSAESVRVMQVDPQRGLEAIQGTHTPPSSTTNIGDSRDVHMSPTRKDTRKGSPLKLEMVLVAELDDVEKQASPNSSQRRRQSLGRLEDEDPSSLSGLPNTMGSCSTLETTDERVSDRMTRPIRYWSEPHRLPRSVFIARKQFSEPIRTRLDIIPEALDETLASTTTLSSAQSDYPTSSEDFTTGTESYAEDTQPTFSTPLQYAETVRSDPVQVPPVPLPRESSRHPEPRPRSTSALREKLRKIGVRVLEHPFCFQPFASKARAEPEDSIPVVNIEPPTSDINSVRTLKRVFEDRPSQRHLGRHSTRAVPRPRKTRTKERMEASKETSEANIIASQCPSTSRSSSLVGRRIRAFQDIAGRSIPRRRSNRETPATTALTGTVTTAPVQGDATGEARTWTASNSPSQEVTSALPEGWAPDVSLVSAPQLPRRQRKMGPKGSAEAMAKRCESKTKRKVHAGGRHEVPRPLPRLLSRAATSREQPESSSSFSVQDASAVDSLFAVTSTEFERRQLNSFHSFDGVKSSCSKLSRHTSGTNSSESEWYSCTSTDSDECH